MSWSLVGHRRGHGSQTPGSAGNLTTSRSAGQCLSCCHDVIDGASSCIRTSLEA